MYMEVEVTQSGCLPSNGTLIGLYCSTPRTQLVAVINLHVINRYGPATKGALQQ